MKVRWAQAERWFAAAQENAENESESELCHVNEIESEYVIEKRRSKGQSRN